MDVSIRRIAALVCLLAGLFEVSSSEAAIRTWPGAAPCDTTLQACIDGASDGDRIEIATDTPITGSIAVVNPRLTLTAANGHKPVFRNGTLWVRNLDFSGDISLTLSKLRFEDAVIDASYTGGGTATFDFRQLDMAMTDSATNRGIRIQALSGTTEAMLYDNRILANPGSGGQGLITLLSLGGALDASAYYNRIERAKSTYSLGMGIYVSYSGATSTGTVKLHGNVIVGSFTGAAIYLSEGITSDTGTNFDARLYSNVIIGRGQAMDTGITLVPNNGEIDAQLVNNTITRTGYGVRYSHYTGGTGETIGTLKNNLIVADGTAVFGSSSTAGSVTNAYNLINGPTIGFVADPSTITAPAKLVGPNDARLQPDSPAIDAADTSLLGLGILFNGLPVTDADGLRRIKKPTPSTAGTAKADIGAYEYGDISFRHTATPGTISGHITQMDQWQVNGQPAANLFATPKFDGTASGQPVGTWYSGSRWHLFSENTSIGMLDYARYHVFSAGAGSGAFQHVTTPTSISGATSRLDVSGLNNLPDRIVLAMQNFNAGDSVYNPNHIGVLYFGVGGTGYWYVNNMDSSKAMPVDAGFSIYFQEPSPNAFKVTAASASSYLVLDHPLLNNNPCALPVVTRVFTASDGSDFDIDYATGLSRWMIYDYDGMAAGSEFHVLVNPAQAEPCGAPLFSDGFE
ncbi:MAG TPA: choice-of-anchor Q domain-containing protein [Chiayiivirga sp.]|nr:choice-of-anchor Q domain-containing protein [Chiayiivirga sp.]